MPQINYDQKQDVFLVKGILKETIPFSIHYYYRIASPESELRQGTPNQARETSDGWQFLTPEINLTFIWKEVKKGVEITLRLKNHTQEKLFIQGICPVDMQLRNLLLDLKNKKFYQHGFQSWSPSRPVTADQHQVYPRIKSFALMNQNVDPPFWGRKDGLISHLFTLLNDTPDGEVCLFAGFLSQRIGLGEFFLRNNGGAQLTGYLDYGGKKLNPEEELITEPLVIQYGLRDQLIAEFMDQLGQNMNARVGVQSPVGWCSWYEFYTRVNQEHVRANTQYLADNPDLGISFVQLDDGYQAAVGDWLSINEKFPSGLEPIARDIHEQGFKAGIWLAPFFASRRSNLFKTKEEWFLKDRQGRPVDCGYNPNWKARTVALDLTHPEVEDWLKNIFGKLKAYGFDFWNNAFLKENEITLAGHATLAIQLSRARKTPFLAGNTFHLTSLADGRIQQHFDQDKNELTIMGGSLSRHTGELWIIVPEDYTPQIENLKQQAQRINTWKQGIRLFIEAVTPWEVTIKFQHTHY